MHVETLDPQHQKVEVDSERPITPPYLFLQPS